MDSQKVAHQLKRLKNDLAEAEEQNERLRSKVASLQQRQQAENILIQAKDAADAPEKLQPASVDDFLAKRANLEDREHDYLEKVAAMVEFAGDGDGLELTGEPSERSGSDPKQLGDWILNN